MVNFEEIKQIILDTNAFDKVSIVDKNNILYAYLSFKGKASNPECYICLDSKAPDQKEYNKEEIMRVVGIIKRVYKKNELKNAS